MNTDDVQQCPKCNTTKPRAFFNAPGVGMGTDYDAWLRGHCVTCQLKHHKRMLDGSLGIVLGGEVQKEAEVRLGILIHHEKLIRHSLEHSDPAARPI